MRRLLLLFTCFLAACQSSQVSNSGLNEDMIVMHRTNLKQLQQAPPKEILTLRNQLDNIYNKDQDKRMLYDSLYHCCHIRADYLWPSIRKNDSTNEVYVFGLLHQYGWLPVSVAGESGEEAIYLVVQHAPLKEQLYALPLLAYAVQHGDAPKAHWAYLFDRVVMKTIAYQVYGTQYHYDTGVKRYVLYPLLYPKLLTRLRTGVGLSPEVKRCFYK